MNETNFLKELHKLDEFRHFDMSQLKQIHSAYLTLVVNSLLKEKKLKLRGFGTFELRSFKGSIKKIGKLNMIIPSKKVIKFRVSKTLTNEINKKD